jgi:hypothetical protein
MGNLFSTKKAFVSFALAGAIFLSSSFVHALHSCGESEHLGLHEEITHQEQQSDKSATPSDFLHASKKVGASHFCFACYHLRTGVSVKAETQGTLIIPEVTTFALTEQPVIRTDSILTNFFPRAPPVL